MLLIFDSINNLSFGKLMAVYEEGNSENAALFYRNMDRNAAILRAEQDFYGYLEDYFFRTKGAFYAIWVENDSYISALRMEPFHDGYLLEALETSPAYRRRGFALQLMKAVLSTMNTTVYSHVSKDNTASMRCHEACGFVCISDTAEMISGEISNQFSTWRWR